MARVTSYFYCTSYELLFAYELELLFIAEFTSELKTMSYNKDKDDKAIYVNKFMINNFIGIFF